MNDFGKGVIYGIAVVTLVSAYGKAMYNRGAQTAHKLDNVIIEGYRGIVDILNDKLDKEEESE